MNETGGRFGPKAAEEEIPETRTKARSLSLRAVIPNAITAAALCAGLTGIRFAIAGDFEKAAFAMVLAGLLDVMDGRIARLLKAQSRFGAELDSLADSISFGVAPAIILYLWSLQDWPRFGWFASLAFALACALRLARFNAQIDEELQPHKSAGFLTGIPAPVGAGISFLPFYLWTATGEEFFKEPLLVSAWITIIAFLMVSNMATFSWSSMRPRRGMRLAAIGFVGMLFAALLLEPWWSLSAISIGYLLVLPYALWRYSSVKRQPA